MPTAAESTTPEATVVVEGEPEVVVLAPVVVVTDELFELQAASTRATNAMPVAAATGIRRCAVRMPDTLRTVRRLMPPFTVGLPVAGLCVFQSICLS